MATINQVQWDSWCDGVTNAMKVHTRPYVTPLVETVVGRPAEIGTGNFIERQGIDVLTCEHVACNEPFEHEFYGHPPLVPLPVTWRSDRASDAAIASVPNSHWNSVLHHASALPLNRFAPRHQPVDNEMLFFRGFAGENATLGHGFSRFVATGYTTQEKPGSGDTNIFELLWHPPATTVSPQNAPSVAETFKHNHPGGFSGSLVWNTRFVETGCNLSTWSPQDAQVTGLLRRWDFTTKTLLVWRVEHLLAWL